MLLGAVVGFVGSGFMFFILSKMQRRDGATKELKKMLLDMARKELKANPGSELSSVSLAIVSKLSSDARSSDELLAIASGSNVEDINKTKQEYMGELEDIRAYAKKSLEQILFGIDKMRENSEILAKHKNPDKHYISNLRRIDDKFAEDKHDVYEYFKNRERTDPRKRKEPIPLSKIIYLSGYSNIVQLREISTVAQYYREQSKYIEKCQTIIEQAETLYQELLEKYDTGYLIDVISRMKSVSAIKTKMLNGHMLTNDNIRSLENAVKKLEQAGDIPALVVKEMKKETALLKRISKIYIPTDAKSRSDYEFLASKLSDILSNEHWGRNPRMEIHKQRENWLMEETKRFNIS